MINTWILENFKSVRERTTLQFSPLTVFAGANSSGKSTIIQSILLTTQSVQSQVQSRPIILNGHIARLGNFQDIISNNATKKHISVGFQLGFPTNGENNPAFRHRYYRDETIEKIETIDCIFDFSADANVPEKEILQLQPRLESARIEIRDRENPTTPQFISVSRKAGSFEDRLLELKASTNRRHNISRESLLYTVESNSVNPKAYKEIPYYDIPRRFTMVGSHLNHFLPNSIAVSYDYLSEQISRSIEALYRPERSQSQFTDFRLFENVSEVFRQKVTTILSESIPTNESVSFTSNNRAKAAIVELINKFNISNLTRAIQSLPNAIRQDYYRRIDENKFELERLLKGDQPEIIALTTIPMPERFEVATDFINGFFDSGVKYLGPLRDEPKPVYPLAGSIDPKDIGFKGEYTAAVLDVHRNTMIHYIPCDQFSDNKKEPEAKAATLITAVLDWLQYLGIANNVSTHDKGKLGHELQVSISDGMNMHDLTHVGVGVSQVLPILVLSLLSDSGSTLIFEQPELHLNPRVQTRLADFFVSMTMINKQCIIETHSEYLINRLRYMSATGQEDEIAKSVTLFFVEKNGDSSTYRPIRINKYGVIEDWPAGFFDENEKNATDILRAGMAKRKGDKPNS